MTDNTLTEDDDGELIPVETAPEDEQSTAGEVDEPQEDEEDDERLAESEDDHDEEITSANRKRRQKRREMQRKARDATQRELDALRRNNEEMARRLAAVEGYTLDSSAQNLDARLNQTLADIRQAEAIMAKATEAGNGEDVVAAMRIRDAAIAEANQLQTAKQQMAQSRQQQSQPQVDPNVIGYARQWMEANPWYDPNGGDRDSALTKAIDNELAREGYNPASRDYWEELTARVADALGESEPAPSKPRRKAPPIGNTREHAPTNTRKEIYVTPERKQAMIEAGVWDDPTLRQRYLKAYQAYDNGSAR